MQRVPAFNATSAVPDRVQITLQELLWNEFWNIYTNHYIAEIVLSYFRIEFRMNGRGL